MYCLALMKRFFFSYSVHKPLWLGFLCGSLFISPSVWADDTHYQGILFGGRAIVLGGAFTSIANEPSGLFFNPAGLVDSNYSSLQVSTSLYGIENTQYDTTPGFQLPFKKIKSFDTDFVRKLVIVPAAAGFVYPLVRGVGNRVDQSIGIAILVPAFQTYSTDAIQTSAPHTPESETPYYHRTVIDREFWTGAGYSYRLNERWSFGASFFYVLRVLEENEELSSTIDSAKTNGKTENEPFRLAFRSLSASVGNILGVFGVKYKHPRGFRLGMTFFSPSSRVNSNTELRLLRGEFIGPDEDGNSTVAFERTTSENLEFTPRLTWACRLGASYIVPKTLTLSLDITLNGPISYSLFGNKKLVGWLSEVKRNAVANFNFGFEYLLVRSFSVGVGLFTDFPSSSPVNEESTDLQLPHISRYGLSGALGYFGEHSLTRIGLVYRFGSGKDTVPVVSSLNKALNDEEITRPVFVSEAALYFFISSTFRY
ncbi:MAG: hypothetical protein VYA34_06105 [Myxococcota bacterium]|nr:hypothetical protein [Myxococcota bacterium]